MVEESGRRKDTVALVWDIENVSPSIPSTFVKGVLGHLRTRGRLAAARVYGDWSRESLSAAARQLHEESFDLIHLPREAVGQRESIIAGQTVELISIYPHISKLVLVSGDAFYTGMIKNIAAHNVETLVICDAKNAEEELLLRADEYRDFRDLTVVPLEETHRKKGEPRISIDESFVLLREAIMHIEARGKIPTPENVKTRLKLMNEHFSEEHLGFDSWHSYLSEAESRGVVYIRFRDQHLTVSVQKQKEEDAAGRPAIIREFLDALKASEKTHTSEGSKAKLADIGRSLEERGVDFRAHGYSSLKKTADAAAKRGLVEISLKESSYLLRLTKRGREYTEG
ncbi:MAG: NYN domain-containing protein [Spirochaetaceae bacterium]